MLQPYVESLEGLPDLGPLELPPIPDGFDELPEAERDRQLAVRDAQEANLGLVGDLANVRLEFAPVVAPTVAYHLALCGYRRTAIPTGKMKTSQRLAESVIHADLLYPQDARGAQVDFNFAPALRDAIARHLALRGWRLDPAKRWIKRRDMSAIGAVGVWDNACCWVPVGAPDRAEDDLRPEDTVHSKDRPPDVRALAARRDGITPEPPQQWSVKPQVNFIDEERPEE
ncbi:minor tail protein [Mycobacterium Phage Nergal]|nr:minor tail protein [Mycobacterium Phage Nergal]